jgi:hypothetical protein
VGPLSLFFQLPRAVWGRLGYRATP